MMSFLFGVSGWCISSNSTCFYSPGNYFHFFCCKCCIVFFLCMYMFGMLIIHLWVFSQYVFMMITTNCCKTKMKIRVFFNCRSKPSLRQQLRVLGTPLLHKRDAGVSRVSHQQLQDAGYGGVLKYPTPHLKLYFLLTARQDDVFPAREEIPDSVPEFGCAAEAAWFRLAAFV